MNRRAGAEYLVILLVLALAIVAFAIHIQGRLKDNMGAPYGATESLFQKLANKYECEKYDKIKNSNELVQLLYLVKAGKCGSPQIEHMHETYVPPASATENAVIECGTKTEKDICGAGEAVDIDGKFYSTNYQAIIYKDTEFCTADPECGHGKESVHNPWIYFCAPSSLSYFDSYAEMEEGNNPGSPLDESASKKYEFLKSLTLKKMAGELKFKAGNSGVDLVICLTTCADSKSCEAEYKKAAPG